MRGGLAAVERVRICSLLLARHCSALLPTAGVRVREEEEEEKDKREGVRARAWRCCSGFALALLSLCALSEFRTAISVRARALSILGNRKRK
jgi:hypothetical protein